MKTCEMKGCPCEKNESEMIQQDGAYYCSSECARNATDANGKCGCGHRGCSS